VVRTGLVIGRREYISFTAEAVVGCSERSTPVTCP
jgi:hypothetical protein